MLKSCYAKLKLTLPDAANLVTRCCTSRYPMLKVALRIVRDAANSVANRVTCCTNLVTCPYVFLVTCPKLRTSMFHVTCTYTVGRNFSVMSAQAQIDRIVSLATVCDSNHVLQGVRVRRSDGGSVRASIWSSRLHAIGALHLAPQVGSRARSRR